MNQATAPSTRQLMKMAKSALQKHKGQEAINLLQQVLAINPHHAEALHTIAFIMHSAGDAATACDYYQRAIQADPSHMESYAQLCRVLESQNRGNEAIQLAHHATQVAPNDPATHATLVSLLIGFNRVHEVPAYLAQVMPRFPNDLDLKQSNCLALKFTNQFAEANAAYQELITKFRPPLSFRIMYETYLPRLYGSTVEIDAHRAAFQSSVARFTAEKGRIDLVHLTSHSLFTLAFHNRDNKEILASYTRMLRVIAPALNFTASHCKTLPTAERTGPLRVGFVSRFMHDHSVGNCYRNIMLSLETQSDFSVTFFNLSGVVDDKIQGVVKAGIPMITMPKHALACQKVIADEKIDVLLYTDIGMDTMTHCLAMMRLAPYQACFQGHPETTGIDTIDYVISSRSYEPEHADDNYGERLLCTSGIDTVFNRPQTPDRWLSRAELELPEGKNLYVCPMAIQKFHPDFDAVLAAILARDPNAVLVLFNDFQQHSASVQMQERLLTTCDKNRVIFMPWVPVHVLFSVIKTADAVLDTIYFGGGTTAQYAFHFGIPIVTMPGDYARGRVVYSYYAVMGITDDAPIAKDTDEYVAIATRLANDKPYAATLSERIMTHNHLLFETAPYAPRVAQLIRDIAAQNLDPYRR